jgi:RND family efflux transporter MFP subunit
VEVATAKSTDIVHTVQVVGNLESPQKVVISPKVTGRIEYLQAREGDPVVPGQVLVRLDPSDLRQQMLQQQAAVAEARSRLAQAQLGQGSNNVSITSQIQQQRAGLTSAQADLNQAQQNYSGQVQSAQAGVASSEAKLRSAQVQVTNAKAQLAQQQSSLANAQGKLDRMQTLFAQGAVSAQARDDAQTTLQMQQQAVNVAQGQIASAQAAVESANADLTSSKEQLGIVKRQGVATIASAKARLSQAQASLNVAAANRSQSPAYQQNIAALRASLAAAQAQYEAARVRLADTVLRSPVKGSVTSRGANPGELATPGTSLLTVEVLDRVYVNAAIPVSEAAGVLQGMMADVAVDALPGRTFTGTVTNINPSADPANRQFGILVSLANPGHILKPGMFGTVTVTTNRTRAKVAVPVEAVKTDSSGQKTIVVVDKESVAHVAPVVIGATDGKFLEIKSGVAPGDKVVVLSYMPVRDGQTVMLPGAGGKGGGTAGGQGGGTRRRRQQP